jgi:hypothetical protein
MSSVKPAPSLIRMMEGRRSSSKLDSGTTMNTLVSTVREPGTVTGFCGAMSEAPATPVTSSR